MIEFLFAIVIVTLLVVYHTAILALLGFYLAAFISIPIFAWSWAHPVLLVGWIAAYLLIGCVWSVFKWGFAETDRLQRAKETYEKSQVDYERRYGIDGKPRPTLEQYLTEQKTKVSNHKEDFIFYISFWPFNMLWTIIDDPLRRAARRLYLELTGVYQRITDRVWRV